MASLFGISARPAGLRGLAVLLLGAALLLGAPVLADPAAGASRPAGKSVAGKARAKPAAHPLTPRNPGVRTRRSPDAGSNAAAGDGAPRLGQLPSIAGGIPGLSASGFAPGVPVFAGLQPELPEPGPLAGPGDGLGAGRGSGIGLGDGGNGGDDDEGADRGGQGFRVPAGPCVKTDSGVIVWRGSC